MAGKRDNKLKHIDDVHLSRHSTVLRETTQRTRADPEQTKEKQRREAKQSAPANLVNSLTNLLLAIAT